MVTMALTVFKVQPVLMALTELKVPLEPMVLRVHKEFKEMTVPPVHKV